MAGRKRVSVAVATGVGIGAIVGAGIFVLSGSVIALAGSAWLSISAFVLVGIIAMLVALELGELGSIFPNSTGSSYSYVYNAFGKGAGFVTGLMMYFSYSAGVAVIALGFGSYLAGMLGLASGFYPAVLGIILVLALAIVNLLGIKKAAGLDFLLVLVKICILIAFAAFAAFYAYSKGPSNFFSVSSASGGSTGNLLAAGITLFFAYTGFQSISTFTSKIKGGAKGAARAIILSVAISMLVYVMVVVALLLLAPASSYTVGMADPLAFALKNAAAPSLLLIAVGIGALVATASATLSWLLTASRVMYQIGADGLIPRSLSVYDRKRDVASNATILSAVIGMLMLLLLGNIYVIASIANFGLLFTYLMMSLALLHFIRHGRRGTFRMPFGTFLSLITIAALVLFLYGLSVYSLLAGGAVAILLIIIYVSGVKRRPPFK